MTKHTVSSRISRDVVNLLCERGMKLTQIAELLGVTKSYISRVKAGTRNFTLEHLSRLEAALGESLPLLLINAIPRDSMSPELRRLHDVTQRLLKTTGSAGRAAPPEDGKKRGARTRAA